MNRKDTSRWLTIFAALAGGGILGFVCAGWLCKAILHWEDRGDSNDALPVAAFTLLGVIAASVLLPLGVWYFTRKKSDKKDTRPGY